MCFFNVSQLKPIQKLNYFFVHISFHSMITQATQASFTILFSVKLCTKSLWSLFLNVYQNQSSLWDLNFNEYTLTILKIAFEIWTVIKAFIFSATLSLLTRIVLQLLFFNHLEFFFKVTQFHLMILSFESRS